MPLGTPLMGTDPSDWKWVQIAEPGSFKGHPAGPFELNGKVFDEIVANFKRDGIPIIWDFEHASEADSTSGSIPSKGAPAQGWIHDLEHRGPAGLWALVEWGPLAKEYIRSGQYRFCSPAVRFGSRDRVTGQPIGARLTSVALTGTPFLKSMQPLAAKDAAPAPAAADKLLSINSALGLQPTATPKDARERIVQLREACAQSTDGTHDGVLLDDYLQPLVAITGMTSCTVSDLLDTVDTMIDAAMAQHRAVDHAGDQQAADALSRAAWDARSRLTQPNPMQSAMTAAEPKKDTVMTVPDTNAIALKDAQEKAGQLEVALKDATDKALKAEVALKDVTARADTAEKVIADVSAVVALKDGETLIAAVKRIGDENAALLKEKADRYEADLIADVDRTIRHYKLKADQKPHLLAMARGAREAFNANWPPLTDEQAQAKLSEREEVILQTQIVPNESKEAAQRGGPDPEDLSFTAMTSKVISEAKAAGKTITLTDAQNEAQRRMREAKKAKRG